MRFQPTPIADLFVVELEPHLDERGFFARTFCRREFAEQGIEMEIVQANTSFSHRAGTLRGLHYQEEPHGEQKLMRCTRGAVFDVAVDIREGSATRGEWYGTELSDENLRMLLVPKGFAHGFQTLVDDTEVAYLMGHEYVPEADRGVRWDDPSIGIKWPEAGERILSERDRNLPLLDS